MYIEITQKELETLINLVSQVQIRAMAPDSVEAATLYQQLGKKLVDSLNSNSNGSTPLTTPRPVREPETLG